jgi:cyclic pyranopterin phosphate synthase
MSKDRLTHLDERGRAQMVNIGEKAMTHRVCIARGEVRMAPETLDRIAGGDLPKGDVLATARLAGIQAAKKTSDWIPLCHPLPLDSVAVELTPDPARAGETTARLLIAARAETHWRTGVEMEALTAASAAALTIYDMCKAIDRAMVIGEVRLVYKSGGKSGDWSRPDEPVPADPTDADASPRGNGSCDD